jgi:hypothetical protein
MPTARICSRCAPFNSMINQRRHFQRRLSRLSAILVIGAAGALALSGCTKLAEFNDGLSTLSNPAFVVDSTVYTHEVKNISIATIDAGTTNTTPEIEMSVSVNTGLSGFSPLTSFCGMGGTNTCRCELTWTEVNTIGGGSNSFTRKKLVETTQVQSGLVKCRMSQAFWNEIASGTTVRVTIVPASGNGSLLSAKALGYKKGTVTSANGDFLDETLTPFRNIHRYTCFSKRNSSYEVLNQSATSTDSSGQNPVTVLLGSRFCTGVAGGNGQCATPRNGFSAQSYYRNLYIRSDKMGEINSTNTYYDCPKVVESIRHSANSSIPSSEKGKYWPLDTTFALATEYSSEWSVGVRSGTLLYKQGDANSVSDACMNEDTNKRLNEKGIIIKCLGYAKVPKPDGGCGQITDSNGRVRPMVRLRRFRVVYPGTFQSNGQVDSGGVEADEVYVADRLVVSPTGVPTGAMVYGPKPCNFSWFDHEGVVNRDSQVDFGSNLQRSTASAGSFARPAYVGTNFFLRNESGVKWSVNPDGLVFPTFDRDGAFTNLERPFCAATLPRVEDSLGTPSLLRLTTSHQDRTDSLMLGTRKIQMKEVHLKPVDAWTPNYVEDTTFQACVPVADPYLEPPLHFYRKNADDVEIAWCAKSYPTQNPYWLDLNGKKKPTTSSISQIAVNFGGATSAYTDAGVSVTRMAPVLGYTSHDNTGVFGVDHALDDKNPSCVGTKQDDICLMSLGSTGHPNYLDSSCQNYLATARTTCDRTVTFDANQAYRGFPLQARDQEITTMLSQDLNTDHSFSCQYSVHSDPSKIGTKTPLSGCCGIISGTPLLGGLLGASGKGKSGHLEPYLNGAVPNIRFCGNPVDVP